MRCPWPGRPSRAARRRPAVLSVGQSGRFTDIMSSDAPATLRVLLAADPSLTDLTVKKPTLEDAFLDLTRPKGEAA